MNDRANLEKLKLIHKELMTYSTLFGPEDQGRRELKTERGSGFVQGIYKILDFAIAIATFAPDTVFQPHAHPELEYFIILDGSCTVVINDIPVPLSKGNVYKVKSNFEHWVQTDDESCKMLVISVPANPEFPKPEHV
jgi:mannose-6-phosphate isomerase-like protein (cupin superfamily)